MIKVAAASALFIPGDERLRFSVGVAEHLPFRDGSFDLVVSVTSFDHLRRAGGTGRVPSGSGPLAICWSISSPDGSSRRWSSAGPARRVPSGGANRLLDAAGFGPVAWHRVYAVIINSAVATA